MLDKAVLVIDALEAEPRNLSELVASTGLSRATTHRLAVALEAHGWVGRDEEGRFRLGVRLLALGQAAGETEPLADVARPVLDQLRATTGESAQLYVRAGERRVCVASLESPHGLRTIVAVGAVLPLDRGSAGKVLRGAPAALRRGWTASVGEREAGVASVSAPVRDAHGQVVAAVGVSGPIDRTGRRPGPRYADAVTAAAGQIEAALRDLRSRRLE